MRRLTASVVALGVAALGLLQFPARAAETRTATATPSDQLVDGQYINVVWQGFVPNREIRARLCPADATKVDACAKDSQTLREAGDSKLVASGTSGGGSTPFVVRAGEVTPITGTAKFLCDTEHPCRIYVFQLDANGIEEAFSSSAFVALGFALSTIACPENPGRIAGSGATAARSAVVQWQSEVCRAPLSLNVSYSTSNSVNGKKAFVDGLTDADFGATAIPLTADETTALTTKKIRPVQVPVGIGSLVLVYNLWYDTNNDGIKEQITDLQLSPETAAAILEGRIGNWADPAVVADNPQHQFTSKRIKAIGRADNSAATWWLTSWLTDVARSAWEAGGDSFKGGPTAIFPAGNGVVLRTGTDAVAQEVRTFPEEQGVGDVPEVGLIGYVYQSEALKLGLPQVALKNFAGKFVKPTTTSIAAAINAGSTSAEGLFTPNFRATDPNAYPLPVVSYIVAPSGGEGGLDATKAQTLSKFLTYATSDGQKAAEQRGYLPLPAGFTSAAKASIAHITEGTTAGQPTTPSAPGSTSSTTPATPATIAATTSTDARAPLPASSGGTASRTSVASSGNLAAAAPVNATHAPTPVEVVKKTVAGLIKLLDGGSAPVTVPGLIGLGLVALIVGRVLTLRNLRRHADPAAGVTPVAG